MSFTNARAHARSTLGIAAIAVAGAAALATAVAPAAHAEDKKPVAKPTPATSVGVSIHIGDIDGESADGKHKGEIELVHVLEGRLHVVVQTAYDADGNVAERRLHANLTDAFATSVDGAVRLPATGSDSEVRPAQPCGTESGCPPEVWPLRFDLPHGFLTLRIATRYGTDGALADVAVLRQDGPPILG